MRSGWDAPDWLITAVNVLRWGLWIALVFETWNHYPQFFWGVLRFLLAVAGN